MTWRDEAACADMAAWWFRKRPPNKTPEAKAYDDERKRICATCPVMAECRAEARELEEPSGVWGGETADERCKRLDALHGPVARSCAWCRKLFVPNVARVVSCSAECRKQHDAERHKRSAEKVRATRVPTSRPCPRCGEPQNMSSGVCQGWVCVAVRRRESRRRVLA